MVRVLIVEPDDSWCKILKHNIGQIALPEFVDVRVDYRTVDSLLGLTQNCAGGAKYGAYVINASIPMGPGGPCVWALGIELAKNIAEIKEQPLNSMYLTSSSASVLEEAEKNGFVNLYLRQTTDHKHFPSELLLYQTLRAFLERLREPEPVT